MQNTDHQSETLLNLEKAVSSLTDTRLKIKSVYLYQIFQKIVSIDKNRIEKEKKLREEGDNNTFFITNEMDQIIEGNADVKKEAVENWVKNEPELLYTDEDLQKKKIKNFWLNFIVNYDICKLKRQWTR